MKIISAQHVHETLSFSSLIAALDAAFSQEFTMPQRKVFHLDQQGSNEHSDSNDAFALLPSWNNDVIGTKAFTYFPENDVSQGLQSLYSKIMLFKRSTGEPLALVDGTSITYWRTAAVSALASQYLSRQASQHLVLFGTGNLASYLIKAHLTVRAIKQVTIVARCADKANAVIEEVTSSYSDVNFNVICHASGAISDDGILQSAITDADIVVCATGSPTPLFDGNWLTPGTHVDCLGNHNVDRRECDTATVTRAHVYVDSLANNLAEAGELLIPMAEQAFTEQNIIGELADICRGSCTARQNDEQITLFKSVGTAISDLVAAHYVFQQLPA